MNRRSVRRSVRRRSTIRERRNSMQKITNEISDVMNIVEDFSKYSVGLDIDDDVLKMRRKLRSILSDVTSTYTKQNIDLINCEEEKFMILNTLIGFPKTLDELVMQQKVSEDLVISIFRKFQNQDNKKSHEQLMKEFDEMFPEEEQGFGHYNSRLDHYDYDETMSFGFY